MKANLFYAKTFCYLAKSPREPTAAALQFDVQQSVGLRGNFIKPCKLFFFEGKR